MVKTALESIVGTSGASIDVIVQYLTDNILGQVLDLLPIVLPAVIGFVAFRKGFKFLKGTLKSA